MINHNRGSKGYNKPQTTEFTHYLEFSSPQEIGNEKIDENSAGQNWTIQFFQIEQKKELGIQALINLPLLSLSTQKEVGRSSRDFTHRLLLLLHFLHLHHHEREPKEGNQMEEGEMRMPHPCHHSQS
jgi:hypothetical protein